MGAAKLPEQIGERIDAGLRAMLEDQKPDPIMERLKAIPVKRVIRPEEKNRRRKLSPEAEPDREAIARKITITRRSKLLVEMLATLRSTSPHTPRKIVDEKIALLRQQIRMLRAKLPSGPVSKKQWGKARAKPSRRR